MMKQFDSLRAQYGTFHYHDYHILREPGRVALRFDFSIEGLCEFHPVTTIDTRGLPLRNPCGGPIARELVFALGLVELASYWKCACPPTVKIHCGALDAQEIAWWKRLWYHGLGEFFYRNGIGTDFDSFVSVECGDISRERVSGEEFQPAELSLVPVGGGKDSCVTLQLLKEMGRPLYGFTVNDQPARADTFAAAGFAPERLLRTHRTIDPALLARNAEGFLNGHTPFSAVVAFLGLYCAYLIGAGELVLSNEASANEASVPGTDVNHQYSKSYQFERGCNAWLVRRLGLPIRYFSLLRPFHELQIARQFAALPQYHSAFKSCNAGSKRNAWCGRCAKCLFVCLMLAPFLPESRMTEIFGENLLEKPGLQGELRALLGESHEKPFECVGTVEEARAAMDLLGGRPEGAQKLLRSWNPAHNIPAEFLPAAERMYAYVSAAV
ncbi:MAG: hypothetical protein FWC27_14270 [Firmicutes bacterium]|nr:hypothetical protein [Bacillota bacterium]